ncbi:SAP domain containing protein [Elaphomyces granulatus]
MTDYSKLKVTELKAELKRRGIPQTGLKLKQNLIDRLLEADKEEQKKNVNVDADAPTQQTSTREDEGKETPAAAYQDTGGLLPKTQSSQREEPSLATQSSQREEPSLAVDNLGADLERDTVSKALLEDSVDDRPESRAPTPQRSVEREFGDETLDQRPRTPDPAEGIAAAIDPSAPLSLSQEPSTSTASEGTDDLRKRKRRSQSPPPSPEMTKKAKLDNDSSPVDARRLSSHNRDIEMVGYSQASGHEVTEVVAGHVGLRRDGVDTENSEGTRRASITQEELPSGKAAAATTPILKHDARFKDLFSGTSRENIPPVSPQREDIVNDDQDREVEPAVHPATSALYIRGFMRPLQLSNLKNHLISLASSPKSSPSATVIRDFFLDSIKTHCLVSFASVSIASRVRSALHGAVWPNERDRKPLWVDFVPAEKLSDWIRIERESESRVRGGPRWEVVYEDIGDGIDAALREAPALSRAVNSKTNIRGGDTGQSEGNAPRAPLGPRGSVSAGPQRDNQGLGTSRHRTGDGFKALDDLFKSTRAKPKLYYLPVASGVARRRLDHFAALARKGPRPRRGVEEMRRYTFEDTDVIVDKGPEYGNRAARGGRGRGGSSWRGR